MLMSFYLCVSLEEKEEEEEEEEKGEFKEGCSKEDGEKATAAKRRKVPKSQSDVLLLHEDKLPLWLSYIDKPIKQQSLQTQTRGAFLCICRFGDWNFSYTATLATKTFRLLPPWRVLLKRFFEPCSSDTCLSKSEQQLRSSSSTLSSSDSSGAWISNHFRIQVRSADECVAPGRRQSERLAELPTGYSPLQKRIWKWDFYHCSSWTPFTYFSVIYGANFPSFGELSLKLFRASEFGMTWLPLTMGWTKWRWMDK